MLDTVKAVCQSCLICQFFSRRMDQKTTVLPLLHMSLNARCGAAWVVDSWSSGANTGRKQNLLLAVCMRCRYSKALATEVLDGKTVTKFFLSLMDVSIPEMILTDNASYFIGQESKDFFRNITNGLKTWKENNKEKINEEPDDPGIESAPSDTLFPSENQDIFCCFKILPADPNGSCLFQSI